MEENNEGFSDSEPPIREFGSYGPKLDLSRYIYPTLDLLPETTGTWMRQMLAMRSAFTVPLLLSTETEPVLQELYHHPNVLLAGTIASGKTQFIYNQLLCWLYTYHPTEIKFVICHSKPVDYNTIAKTERHFLASVRGTSSGIAEESHVRGTINALVAECSMRLSLFRSANVKNILDYNERFVTRQLKLEEGHHYMPSIVLIMDDLYNFLDVETQLALVQLTQQNLYTGIYVVAVTSQIMARSISPQLKANFSLRLAMKLMSQNESRKILDRVGAEKLSNPGELLYEESGKLRHGLQPLIDYPTIALVTDFIGQQSGYPSTMSLPEFINPDDDYASPAEFDINNPDALFEEAARLIVMHQQGSTSLIQRKLKLGYNRAGRIIDQLEAAGIVGPFEGSKQRDVLFPDEYSLEQFLDALYGKESSTVQEKKDVKEVSPAIQKPLKSKKTSPLNSAVKPVPVQTKQSGNLITWIIIIVIAALIYMVSGWLGLVGWFR